MKIVFGRLGLPLLAFLIPLSVRAVPEFLAWPYPIGFDTLLYAFDIMKGNYLTFNIGDVFRSTYAFNLIATVVAMLIGDPLLTLKVLGPVLFSSFCGCLYLYSRKVLGWDPWKALAVSVVAGTYFVSLRVSWEMYQQMMGSVFLLVALTGLRVSSLRWRIFVVTLSGFLSVWSHELTAVLFFVIMATHLSVRRGLELRAKILLALMTAPAFLLFIYMLYSPAMGSISVPYEVVSAASRFDLAIFISGFIAYISLPLLPLVALGVCSFRGIDMLSWLAACLVFAYWPVFLPEYSVVFWFRWAILTVYPMAFFSVEGVDRLWRLRGESLGRVKFGRLTALSILSVNLVMSGFYLTSLPERQMPYFGDWNNYKQYIQTSMLQNSVSLSDTPDVVEAIRWLGERAEGGSVLVLHEAMDNWARLLVRNIEIVRVDEAELSSQLRENVSARLVHLASEKMASGVEVYTVWWVDGKGWYGMPEIPPQFKEIQRFGNIGAFQYVPSKSS